MKSLQQLKYDLQESISNMKNHPIEKMGPETKEGMDWEYHTEYEKYSKGSFPHAFKSREHFQKAYDETPLRHLTHKEAMNLGNSNLAGVISHKGDKEAHVRAIIGKRRNVDAIKDKIHNGITTPPIILQHDHGLHLMAGNTRLITGASQGVHIPAKIIDIRKNK